MTPKFVFIMQALTILYTFIMAALFAHAIENTVYRKKEDAYCIALLMSIAAIVAEFIIFVVS